MILEILDLENDIENFKDQLTPNDFEQIKKFGEFMAQCRLNPELSQQQVYAMVYEQSAPSSE